MNEEDEEETTLLYVKISPNCSASLRVTKQELEEIKKVRKEHPELTRRQAIDQVLDKSNSKTEN